jgi:hypothetical protein
MHGRRRRCSRPCIATSRTSRRRTCAAGCRSSRGGSSIKLTDAALDARDRKHFHAIAALAMRQILVDRARRRSSRERGGDHAERVTLSQLASDEAAVDVVAVDLEPANIMVRRDGTVSIVDFGVARAPTSQGRTQIGDLLGTPLYMSPEQALGRASEVDARSDIYSLGVILFELVAGPAVRAEGPVAAARRPRHHDDAAGAARRSQARRGLCARPRKGPGGSVRLGRRARRRRARLSRTPDTIAARRNSNG